MAKKNKKTKIRFEICPNCDTKISIKTNYCPSCGQKNQELNVPFSHLIGEFIETIFHIDTKFWNTFKTILVPGKLTKEFVAGKRASYMPPARFYIFVSFIFFLLTNYGMQKSVERSVTGDSPIYVNTGGDDTSYYSPFFKKELKLGDKLSDFDTKNMRVLDMVLAGNLLSRSQENRDSLKEFITTIRQYSYETIALGDSSIQINSEELYKLKYTNSNNALIKQIIEESNLELDDEQKKELVNIFSKEKTSSSGLTIGGQNLDTLYYLDEEILKSYRYKSGTELDSIIESYNLKPDFYTRIAFNKAYDLKNFDRGHLYKIVNLFTKYLSYVMFLLMPLVAILLWLIYRRRKKHYYEYFIFSIHTHTILFFFAIFEVLIRIYFFKSFFPTITILGMMLYYFLAMKRVYGQSWRKTFVKFLLLFIAYSTILTASIALIMLLSFIYF